MMYRHFVVLSLVGLIAIANADPVPKPKLKGTTLIIPPIVTLGGTTFSGYGAELVGKIAEKAGFEYELSLSPDLSYGSIVDNKPTGMIGQVFEKKADFALADLTITEERKRFVDFTEPIIENQLSALIRKEDATGLTTMEDLVKRNQEAAKSTPPGAIVSYGVVKGGSTYSRLSSTTDEVGREIFSALRPESLMPSINSGKEKVVAEGGFAMIVESTMADYIVGQNCNLTALPDTRNIHPRLHAIALAKGSPYLEPINQAIRELKADGTMASLKAKYWKKNC